MHADDRAAQAIAHFGDRKEDVLDANIQFAGTMLSSSLKVSFFICIFSLTASMIRSASLKISFVPIVILSSI